jgi:hypothetical protein
MAWRFAEQMCIQPSWSFGDYIVAGTLRNVLRLGEIVASRLRPGEGNFSVLARSWDRA